jgi:ABC-type branched-subunit amino acid transport system substrate-binding protein
MSGSRKATTALVVCCVVAAVGATVAMGTSSKKPVLKIGLIGTQTGAIAFPETVTGAQAAVNAINKAGGVRGYTLQLDVCDNQFDANLDTQCGQKMVNDHVFALAAGFALFAQHLTATDAAKIPDVGTYSSVAGLYSDPLYYPLQGYSILGQAGPVSALTDLAGDKTIALISANTGGVSGPAIVSKVLSYRPGTSLMNQVTMAAGQADPSPYLNQALQGNPDGILFTVSGSDNNKLTQLVRQLSPQTDVGRSSTSLDAKTIATIGKLANGIYASSQFLPPSATDNPGVVQWKKEMLASGSNPTFDDFSANSWAAIHLLAQAISRIPKSQQVTSANLINVLNKVRVWNTLIGPPISFVTPIPTSVFGLDGYTRVFCLKVTYNEVINGQLVNVAKNRFTNVFATPRTS